MNPDDCNKCGGGPCHQEHDAMKDQPRGCCECVAPNFQRSDYRGNVCQCPCHQPSAGWEEKIRNDYRGIIQEGQIEATIKYWREILEAELEKARTEGVMEATDVCNLELKRVRKDERDAWLAGARCDMCGKEHIGTVMNRTCPKCWEEA